MKKPKFSKKTVDNTKQTYYNIITEGGRKMQTLKQLREGKGITQKELAESFGVSDRTIYSLEKSSENIKDSVLKKYIESFDVSYDNIFLGNEYEINVFENKAKNEVLNRALER